MLGEGAGGGGGLFCFWVVRDGDKPGAWSGERGVGWEGRRFERGRLLYIGDSATSFSVSIQISVRLYKLYYEILEYSYS